VDRYEEPYFISSRAELRNENDKELKIKCFVSSDYKFYAEIQGKPNRVGAWCPYCDLRRTEWKACGAARGTEWMTHILSQNYRDDNRDANKVVVKEALVKSVEPENYLIALLHQLLGTGNGSQLRSNRTHVIDLPSADYPCFVFF